MAEQKYVWVISSCGAYPYVERCELVRQTKTQIVVRCRGADEHYIRPQIGHVWCFEEAIMQQYVEETKRKTISDAEARIRNATAQLAEIKVHVVPYTPGPQPPIRTD